MSERSPAARAGATFGFVHASAVGSSHGRSGTPCQDAALCEVIERADGAYLVAAVSDGAGSAPLSHLGARLACQAAAASARAFLAEGRTLAEFERERAEELVVQLRARLARTARRADVRTRDLACTLLFALLGPEGAVFAQLGDGALVAARADAPAHEYDTIFWPQRGEYANETHFVTEAGAERGLLFETRAGAVRELALLSDGLQDLVLDQRTRQAHARFFAPMFATLDARAAGHDALRSAALERYLASPRVRARTDDDTTLVLVRRTSAEPAAALPRAPADTLHGERA